ncbi:MAG TPA: hypothetical protein VLI42_08955 [Chthoniobacterales bacterium]|nr:hypothetical protein [Chthoniobacterales bacterium]
MYYKVNRRATVFSIRSVLVRPGAQEKFVASDVFGTISTRRAGDECPIVSAGQL